MIYLLTKRDFNFTLMPALNEDRKLRCTLRLLSYEKLFRMKSLPGGTYIFADLERLDREDTEKAAIVWRVLNEHSEARTLNDPIRSMRRYELLRNMHEYGSNSFNVYRLVDVIQAQNFPVFIRSEDEHRGSATPLLNSKEEVVAAEEELVNLGESRENKIIVEYCDTADENGLFHWYSAYRIQDRIIPANLHFLTKWMSKDAADILKDDQHVAMERDYLDSNPHEQVLMGIFKMAKIDYGRIDYAVVDDCIQVFEINTNPMSMPAEKMYPAFVEIDLPNEARIPIRLPKRMITPRPQAVAFKRQLILKNVLARLGLRKIESLLLKLLGE